MSSGIFSRRTRPREIRIHRPTLSRRPPAARRRTREREESKRKVERMPSLTTMNIRRDREAYFRRFASDSAFLKVRRDGRIFIACRDFSARASNNNSETRETIVVPRRVRKKYLGIPRVTNSERVAGRIIETISRERLQLRPRAKILVMTGSSAHFRRLSSSSQVESTTTGTKSR